MQPLTPSPQLLRPHFLHLHLVPASIFLSFLLFLAPDFIKNNIFARDGNGKTALEIALSNGKRLYPIVINEKTAILKDDKGQSVLHYVIKTEFRRFH